MQGSQAPCADTFPWAAEPRTAPGPRSAPSPSSAGPQEPLRGAPHPTHGPSPRENRGAALPRAPLAPHPAPRPPPRLTHRSPPGPGRWRAPAAGGTAASSLPGAAGTARLLLCGAGRGCGGGREGRRRGGGRLGRGRAALPCGSVTRAPGTAPRGRGRVAPGPPRGGGGRPRRLGGHPQRERRAHGGQGPAPTGAGQEGRALPIAPHGCGAAPAPAFTPGRHRGGRARILAADWSTLRRHRANRPFLLVGGGTASWRLRARQEVCPAPAAVGRLPG